MVCVLYFPAEIFHQLSEALKILSDAGARVSKPRFVFVLSYFF